MRLKSADQPGVAVRTKYTTNWPGLLVSVLVVYVEDLTQAWSPLANPTPTSLLCQDGVVLVLGDVVGLEKPGVSTANLLALLGRVLELTTRECGSTSADAEPNLPNHQAPG